MAIINAGRLSFESTSLKRRVNAILETKRLVYDKISPSHTTEINTNIPMTPLNPFSAASVSPNKRRRHTRDSQLAILLTGLVTVCIGAFRLAQRMHTLDMDNRGLDVAVKPAVLAVRFNRVSSPGWHNDFEIVHVIQTRFMQNQPHLVSLGQARVLLFKAFTIPSMMHQTNSQFLWIVRTDPALDAALKRQLVDALSTVPNAVLVVSNDNPEGFRQEACVADITSQTLLVGSLAMVHSYHVAAATHRVLETRCDADDALSTDFVEVVQASAFTMLQQDWMVWCAENHMEWQYDSPWTNTTHKGALLGLKAPKCITPGLTWGYSVKAARTDIPVSKHQQIQSKIPACVGNSSYPVSRCLIKLGGEMPLALRARTPTSAGMDHVLISEHTEDSFPMQQLRNSKWRHSQDAVWESLSALFGVKATDIWSVRAYINDAFALIVRDALTGQCTRGHSCKDSSREVLQRLFNASSVGWSAQLNPSQYR